MTVNGISADNGYVVVWVSPDDSGSGIYGQRYDTNNQKVGDEFQINSHALGDQQAPALTGLSDGGFVVTWHSPDSATGDDNGMGISAQRYDAEGNAVGSEFLVNTSTSHHQFHPAVSAIADGGFVVTWYDYHGDDSSAGIKAQRFDAEGNPVEAEFLVNSHTANAQLHPDVTGLSNGGFVITWHGDVEGETNGIAGQLYDVDGNAVGDEFLVNTYQNLEQSYSTVAALDDGGFVVTWAGWDQSTGDTSTVGVSAQIFAANGTAVGGEFLVNSFTHDHQMFPTVTALDGGGFVVTWTSYDNATGDVADYGISGQLYDSVGNKVGSEFLVNSNTTGAQVASQVAPLSDGGFIVTWHGYGGNTGDNDGNGISGQRFDADGGKVGDEFLVNSEISGSQSDADVATLGFSPTLDTYIAPTNQAPDADNVSVNGTEDSPSISGSFNAVDPDGDDITYTITSTLPSDQGTLTNNNDGTYTFKPGDDFKVLEDGDSQDVTFTYTATDSKGNVSEEATGTITVDGIDHAPVGNTYTDTGTEDDASITGTLTATDADGGDLTFALEGAPAEGSVTVSENGDFSFVPGNDFKDLAEGTSRDVTFTYTATDAQNEESAPATVTLTITGIDHAPVVTAYTDSGTEDDASITGTLTVTDVDGGDLTFTLAGAPAEGSVTVSENGDFSFVPGNDFKDLAGGTSRDVTFTYTATDSQGEVSAPATVTLTITGIDHAPVVTAYTDSGTEDDASITGTLTATDVDGGDLTFALAGAPAEGTVTVSENGDFSFVPGNDFKDLAEGSSRDVTFTYTATDGQGEISEPATITLTITGIDHAPVVSSYSDTGTEDDASITGTLSATDVDGGDLIFALVDVPAEGSVIVNENGSFTFEPGSDFKDLMPDETRDVTFTYKATDEQGLDSVPATVTLTITGLEHAPVVTNVSFAGNEDDAAIDGQLTATDEEGDAVTFSVVEEPARGSVTVNDDGSFSFAPGDAFQYLNVGENETVSFTYAATDDTGRTGEPATVSITIEGSPEGFVAVWSSYRQDADNWGVFGQRYDEEGVAVGEEFQINTTEDRSQSEASITSLNDGGFVVTWTSYQQDGSSGALMGQRYDADGIAQESEFQINTHTEGHQANAAISGLDNGGFVVSWVSQGQDGHGDGIYGQLFDAVGKAQGDEFLINSTTTFDQSAPSATSLSDGGFVMAWASQGQDGRGDGVFFQRFDTEGEKVGSESQANSHTFGNQTAPVADALSDGGFVIVWESDRQDDSDNGIFGQRFDADGQTVGDEFQINTTTQNNQSSPSIASLPAGGFVVTWASAGQDGDGYGVFAQRFDVDGNPDGGEFMVNSTVAYDQSEPKVAVQEDGSVIISWSSDRQDGSGEGIFAQRYDAEGNAIGGEFQMNTYTRYDQTDVALTALRQEGDGTEVFNRTPTVEDVNLTLNEDDSSVAGSFAGTDADGDAMSYTITSNLAEGEGSLTNNNDGTFTFTPGDDFQSLNEGETEDLTFTYTATDEGGNVSGNAMVTVTVTVTVTVQGADDAISPSDNIAPVVADISIVASEDYAVEGNLVGTDADSDNLTFELTSQPDQGSVTNNNDGSFSYLLENASELNTGETAETQFTYVANDGETNSETANVTIQLQGQSPSLEGGFVVAWSSYRQDGGEWGIYGQKYDAQGNAVGDEFLINTATANSQIEPAITSLSDGGFVVSWTSANEDGSSDGVFAQRYDNDGMADGAAIQVNSFTEGAQSSSALAATSNGGFVAVWNSANQDDGDNGIFGQRFDADGSAVGDEFQINSFTRWDQEDPAVTVLADDGYVVSWSSLAQDGRGYGIFGQQFDAAGNTIGDEFQINTYTRNSQTDSAITALADGGFVVTWESDNQDGSGRGIYGQRFDAAGQTHGNEFQINSETASNQINPVITDLNDGGFAVVWSSSNQDGSGNGVYGQRFDSDALPEGDEFQINTETSRSQEDASIASLDDGGFVVTWSSDRQDGSGVGTFGQRFDSDGNTVGNEFQVNSYTHMHQENAVVTGLAADHTLGAPDSFMHTSTVYANGDQTDLLQTDDDFVLGEIAAQFDSVDTLALSGSEGSEVVVDKNAVLAHTDTDNTLFITGDAGDSVHFTDEGWAEVAASDVDGLSTDWFSNGEVVVIVDQTLNVLSDFDIQDWNG